MAKTSRRGIVIFTELIPERTTTTGFTSFHIKILRMYFDSRSCIFEAHVHHMAWSVKNFVEALKKNNVFLTFSAYVVVFTSQKYVNLTGMEEDEQRSSDTELIRRRERGRPRSRRQTGSRSHIERAQRTASANKGGSVRDSIRAPRLRAVERQTRMGRVRRSGRQRHSVVNSTCVRTTTATTNGGETSPRRAAPERFWRVTFREELTEHTAPFFESIFQVIRLLLYENTGLAYLLTSSFLRTELRSTRSENSNIYDEGERERTGAYVIGDSVHDGAMDMELMSHTLSLHEEAATKFSNFARCAHFGPGSSLPIGLPASANIWS